MKNLYKVLCAVIFLSFAFSTGVYAHSSRKDTSNRGKKNTAQKYEKKNKEERKKMRVAFATALNECIQKKAWDDALQLFENLSEEDKNDRSIQNLKIAVLISQGNIAEAERIAKLLEKDYPRDVDVLYTLSMIGQAKNDDKMRKAYLKKILAVDKNNVQALYEQGLDYYKKKQYNKAHEMFSRILKTEPDNIDALIWIGQIYYMQNKLTDAEQYYTKALALEPQNSLAISELARVYSESDRMHDAITEIKRAIELSPDSAHYWSDLGSYNVQIGKKEEALAAFSEAVKLIPDSYFVHIYLAGLNDDLNHKEEAIKQYRIVTKLYPQYYFAYESLGVLLFEKHDWAGAADAFLHALNYAPKKTEYAVMYGLCSYKAGNKKAAKDVLKKYLKTINKKKDELDYYLCRLFIDFAGDTDVNLRIQKLKSESDKLPLLFYMGAFYQLKGKTRLAEKYYIDVSTTEHPGFYEYRLAVSALKNLNI